MSGVDGAGGPGPASLLPEDWNEAVRDSESDGRQAQPLIHARRTAVAFLRRLGLPAPGEMYVRGVVLRLLLAVTLATVLWGGVSSAEDPVVPRRYLAVPIVVERPAGYYPVHGAGTAIVNVRGLSSALTDASVPAAHVTLDRTRHSGHMYVPVEVAPLPANVELVSIEPATVDVTLERSEMRLFRVVPVLSSNVAPGYDRPTYSISPQEVTITGPSHIVNSISGVRVPVDTSLTHDRTSSVYQEVFDHAGQPVSRQNVRVQPSTVTLSVQVYRKPIRQQLPVHVVLQGQVAPGYVVASLSVNPPLVPVASRTLVSTATLSTAPIVITGRTSNLQVSALLVPQGVTLLSQTQVIVIVGIAPVPSSTVSRAGILAVHKLQGTTVMLGTASVAVAYQGSAAELRGAAAPLALLDLQGRRPGVYQLAPAIVLSRHLSVLSVTPVRIRVVITSPARAPARPKRPVVAQPTPTVHHGVRPHVLVLGGARTLSLPGSGTAAHGSRAGAVGAKSPTPSPTATTTPPPPVRAG